MLLFTELVLHSITFVDDQPCKDSEMFSTVTCILCGVRKVSYCLKYQKEHSILNLEDLNVQN